MYYVLYEYYTEYNQFEGIWSKDWESFPTIKKALKFISVIKSQANYKNISEILVTVAK